MKFEYLGTYNYKPVIEFLNEKGKDGWLLIQQYKDQNYFIFAREKDETV